jgi:hypothetical protein
VLPGTLSGLGVRPHQKELIAYGPVPSVRRVLWLP